MLQAAQKTISLDLKMAISKETGFVPCSRFDSG